jgi:hypothetical protein
MYVVKPVDADGELRPFLSPKAANEWAQTGAYRECGADVCEIYTVDDASKEEAVALLSAGQAGKPYPKSWVCNGNQSCVCAGR